MAAFRFGQNFICSSTDMPRSRRSSAAPPRCCISTQSNGLVFIVSDLHRRKDSYRRKTLNRINTIVQRNPTEIHNMLEVSAYDESAIGYCWQCDMQGIALPLRADNAGSKVCLLQRDRRRSDRCDVNMRKHRPVECPDIVRRSRQTQTYPRSIGLLFASLIPRRLRP